MSSSVLGHTCLRNLPGGQSALHRLANSLLKGALLGNGTPAAPAVLLVPARTKYVSWQDPWDRLNRKKIRKKVAANVIQNVKQVSLAEDSRAQVPEGAVQGSQLSLEYLARCNLTNSSAQVQVGSVYKSKEHRFSPTQFQPEYVESAYNPVSFDHTELEQRAEKRPQFLWEQSGGAFPASPQEAGAGLAEFLEQRDMHRQHHRLAFRPFTVGSVVAVTRKDMYSPKGPVRFVGICTEKNEEQNNMKATFTLRNVILDEAMEIIFYTYSPKILKIEVLKHQVWKDRESDLTCLRDWPHEFYTVDDGMEAEEYTQEPAVYELTEEQRETLKLHFDRDFERRRGVGLAARKREDHWPLGQYKRRHGKKGRGLGLGDTKLSIKYT